MTRRPFVPDPNSRRRTLLITGGAQRIGRAIALEAARRGWNIVLGYRRSASSARRTSLAIAAQGRFAFPLQLDVTRPASLRRAAQILRRRDIRLDLLVNCAARFEATPIDRTSLAQWKRILAINLAGPFFVVQAMRPLLREGGSVVNIADTAAIVPWTSYSAYAASKAGLLMLTKVLARALAPRLRANAVAPGPMLPTSGVSRAAWRRAVSRTALRRPGRPSDVAAAVLFLADSRFITGQTLLVDGGRHLMG